MAAQVWASGWRPSRTMLGLQARRFGSSPTGRSHVGKAPLSVPQTVSLFFDPAASSLATAKTARRSKASRRVLVKGPLGEMRVDVMPFVKLSRPSPSSADLDLLAPSFPTASSSSSSMVEIALDGNEARRLSVTVEDAKDKDQKAVWGLTRTLLSNAIKGVSEGFSAQVRLVGVGYRAELDSSSSPADPARAGGEKRLRMKLGYSHDIVVPLPTTPTFLGAEVVAPTQIVLKSVDKREVGQLAANIRKWRKPEPYNGKGVFVNGETIKRKEVKKK